MDDDELRSTRASEDPEDGSPTLVGAAIVSQPSSTDFDPGAALGRYLVLSRMGEGAMGVVYAAYDPELDRRIALKLMHARGSAAEAERVSTRMLGEAQAMARLSHPNVITVHDVGTIDGRVFIAMEFVEGVPLSRWLDAELRPWPAILAMFIRAGRGLEAAHAAGLVHRDFKPDNVLVGVDGRVRVLDFGLARRFDGSHDAGSPRTEAGEARRDRDRDRDRDREAGTPAYMSPEQHLGARLDHRADQFSFCVALYEALYDEPPFAGKTRLELAMAVTDGRVGSAPKGTLVPSRVRAALLRGLEPDPDRRWDSIGALLAALTRDPYQKLRRGLVGAGAAAVLGLSLGLLVEVGLREDPPVDPLARCSSAGDRVTEVWNEERRAELRDAFARVAEPGPAHERELAGEIELALARWADRWATLHRETCEASAIGEQSDTMLDRRMLCLDRRLAELDELVGVVSGPAIRSLARAGELVRELPDLERCTATALERSGDEAPRSELERLALDEFERDLVRARTLERTGAFAEAEALAETCLIGAEVLGDRRLRAATLLTMAELARAQGDLEAVAPLLESAELEAERAAADRLRADILVALARADVEAGQLTAAERRVRQAQAVFDRVGASELDYVALAQVRGLAAIAAGEPELAEPILREAIARVSVAEAGGEDLEPASPGATAVASAELRTELGVGLRELGRHDAARVELDAARSAWIDLYGPQHPRIAAVELELARVDAAEGRDELALAGYAAVLDTFTRAYGPNALEVGEASEAMAVSLGRLGRYDEALRRHQQARAIFRAKLGGERFDSRAAVELGRALDNEALVRRELQQLDEALSLHQQSLLLLERDRSQSPARLRDRARVLVHLGEVLLDLQRPLDARAPLDEAQQLLIGIGGAGGGTGGVTDVLVLGRARQAAAEAWAAEPEPDRKRARGLALRARADLIAAGDRARVAELDEWLATLEP